MKEQLLASRKITQNIQTNLICVVVLIQSLLFFITYVITFKKKSINFAIFDANDDSNKNLLDTNVYKVVRIQSGLGNQFFQYAFAYVLSKEIKYPVYIDLQTFFSECRDRDCFDLKSTYKGLYSFRKFHLRNFNVSLRRQATKEQIQNIEKHYDRRFEGIKLYKFNVPFDQYFHGSFENLRFYDFNKYVDDFRREFTLRVELPPQHQKYLEMIKSTNSISVHIRRTDHGKLGFLPLDYYKKALKYMDEHVDNPHYFIFSDDMNFVKRNLKFDGNYTFIENSDILSPIFDFELMKNCKHNIIANSTFSWWAAFLNNFIKKIVVAPKIWYFFKDRNCTSGFIVPKNYVTF